MRIYEYKRMTRMKPLVWTHFNGLNHRQRLHHSYSGFTLVEVLVSMSIFIILVAISTNLYLVGVQLQRRGEARRVIEQNATYLMEILGKEIRNGNIDYQIYANRSINLTQPTTRLYLFARGRTDMKTEIFLNTNQSNSNFERVTLSKQTSPGSAYSTALITSAEVRVKSLSFYIFPDTSCTPSSCKGQARVTVVMRIESDPNLIPTKVPVGADFQTTFTTRRYEL